MATQGQVIGTKSGSTVSVKLIGGKTVVTAEVARDLTVADNDIVIMERINSKYYVICRTRTAAAPPPKTENPNEPDPKPHLISSNDTYNPISTNTWDTHKWRRDTGDMWQGNGAVGVAFFGDQVKALKGATITRARLTNIARVAMGGTYTAAASTLWLITEKKRPSGAPTRTSSTAGPSLVVGAILDSFDIPTTWIDAMKNGTAGGIGVYVSGSTPVVRYAGMGEYSSAFSLVIDSERLSS